AEAGVGPLRAGRDRHGDSLPGGALAGLGSLRWRHGGLVSFAALLPDGKTVLTAGDDNAVRVWEFPSGKEIRSFGRPPAAPAGRPVPYRPSGVPVALGTHGKTAATNFQANETHLYNI